MVAQYRTFCAAMALALILVGCSTPDARNAPTLPSTPSFEFLIDPQAEMVSPVEGTEGQALQPQYLPSDTRILVPGEDIALANLQFRFERSGRKVLIRAKLTNISDDEFLQPFFFTLSEKSETKNVVRALAPLVTDEQLGGDGILSPGETTSWLRFELVHKNKPFSIFVDVSAVVEEPDDGCTNPVDIPDQGLENAVRGALGKFNGDITCEDMKSLTELEAIDFFIANLEGLQFAVNLTDLDLRENSISDITPLQNLTKLTELLLWGNAITDITPLQNLTQLTYLNLYLNNISDITPLQSLINLAVLAIDENNISDITALVNNTGLGEGDAVDVSHNPLEVMAQCRLLS